MIYFTTEYNGNADQLILKPLHCEVHTQEVEILLLNIAQCLWKDVFSQRGICGKGSLQKTCSVGKWRKEKEKWKKSLTSENLQWRKVGVGTGLCQARHVSDGERRCWKYLSLRNCLNSFEMKTSIKLKNSKTKSPHLLQEEHTHAAVPREKTSRWPENSIFSSQFHIDTQLLLLAMRSTQWSRLKRRSRLRISWPPSPTSSETSSPLYWHQSLTIFSHQIWHSSLIRS